MALLAATLLWATLVLAESPRLRDWCAYGLLLGFALLTDPSLGAALPLLLGWAGVSSSRPRLHAFTRAGACGHLCNPLLRPLDCAQLRGISPLHTSALEFRL